jgi:putative transposase
MLEQLGVSRATFYRWCDLYQTGGPEALEDRSPRPDRVWSRIPDGARGQVVQLALDEPELSPRELATRFTDTKNYFVFWQSRLHRRDGRRRVQRDKTTASPNQLWQTDFTYLKVIGWGWFSADFAEWLDKRDMGHVRGAPCHPQTQGKIERWHQTLKNRILLENYYLPGDLDAKIDRFVDHYHRRYHESLSNLTPVDVYFGRAQTILLERERIKRATIQNRRLQHQLNAA